MKTLSPCLLFVVFVAIQYGQFSKQQTLTPKLSKIVNKKDSAEMVLIPQGFCVVGDGSKENPVRKVYVKPFYAYKNPVTVQQYQRFCKETGHPTPPPPDFKQNGKHPIVNIRYTDALEYCKWARVDLPTEVEWERLARGQKGRIYPWGDEWDTNRLWHSKNFSFDIMRTTEVGHYIQNELGMSDIIGNVKQWCSDLYVGSIGFNVSAKSPRVVKGGGYKYSGGYKFYCGYRDLGLGPSEDIGFRCIKRISVVKPQPGK